MLSLIHIRKQFASQTVLQDIDLNIQEGEFFSLLGASGCGKTTLLRIIAGLEFPCKGEIIFNGKRINDICIQQRPFHLVFQKYALFPHINVRKNIAFSLELKRVPRKEIADRVDEILQVVGLQDFGDRNPETLSGGQQQRVALARALVNRPKLLLLDEPLSALDQKLREQMRVELRSLQKRLGLTFIFVTHDQEEAMILSDRIAVMNRGRLEQVGTPQELYEEPASPYLTEFIGQSTQLSGVFRGFEGSYYRIEIGENVFVKAESKLPLSMGDPVQLFIRPENIYVTDVPVTENQNHKPANEEASKCENHFQGKICESFYRGISHELYMSIPNGSANRLKFKSVLPNLHAFHNKKFISGSPITFAFAAEDVHLFRG